MATRSTIAKVNDDGSITSIYCHWDGYPEGVGKTLKNHYTDVDKIDQLLALGWLSVLGAEIGTKKDFETSVLNNECLAYGRDRGETDVDAVTHQSLGEWLNYHDAEYGYLFQPHVNKWECFKVPSGKTVELP